MSGTLSPATTKPAQKIPTTGQLIFVYSVWYQLDVYELNRLVSLADADKALIEVFNYFHDQAHILCYQALLSSRRPIPKTIEPLVTQPSSRLRLTTGFPPWIYTMIDADVGVDRKVSAAFELKWGGQPKVDLRFDIHGQTRVLSVFKASTVAEIKHVIAAAAKLREKPIELIASAKHLEDSMTVRDFYPYMREETLIHVVFPQAAEAHTPSVVFASASSDGKRSTGSSKELLP